VARAFANLLTAAAKKNNVYVVVSDLAAAYESGAKLMLSIQCTVVFGAWAIV
jgi:hypothetical protein